ncbi:MAG TPA: hypothetical protein PLN41_06015 [Methanothrix sp.]|jgi:hypothetical protein|nr:hypothetical protein [Methanothrix sp.]
MTLSLLTVDGHKMAVKINEFKLNLTLSDGTDAVFHVPDKKYPFPKPLSNAQTQGLWIITEGTVSPYTQPLPSWRIAKLLNMPRSNVSARVTTPLEKMELIQYDNRPTTRPDSSHPRTPEKVWTLKPISMEKTHDILATYFITHHFNNLVWGSGKDISKMPKENRVAMTRIEVLVFLKRKIDEYENSLDWYHDLRITPPPGISSKKEHEAILDS